MIETTTTNNQRWGLLLVAFLATFLPVFYIEAGVGKTTGGVFMYPLDDVFIHMEIARHLALEGTWGINQNAFGSASSSPLYTLLLAACFVIFSPHTLIPFIINCIAASVLLLVIHGSLVRSGLNSLAHLAIMLLLIFFTPLPIMIVSGMEHTLQCLFVFLFLTRFSSWMTTQEQHPEGNKSVPADMVLYGALVASIRYEGLFLVGAVCLILLWRRKIVSSFILGLTAAAPLVVFGLVSIAKGSYAVPNSLLVKSDSIVFSLSGLLHFFSNVLVEKLTIARGGITSLATQRLLIILPLALLFSMKRTPQKPLYKYLLLPLIICTLLHLALATTGWFYRYEAYLVFGSIYTLSLLTYHHGRALWQPATRPVQVVSALVLFFLFFPLLLRSTAAFSKAKQACINIYEQQYQMGQFLQRYYNAEPIAANDIGAVAYFTNGYVLDLWGLGNIDIARSRRKGYWTPAFLDSMVRSGNTKVAVVYDSWFDSTLLKRWKKVATWQIQNNVICGDDIVSFYAVDAFSGPALRNNLLQYQPVLPAGVTVQYYPF